MSPQFLTLFTLFAGKNVFSLLLEVGAVSLIVYRYISVLELKRTQKETMENQ